MENLENPTDLTASNNQIIPGRLAKNRELVDYYNIHYQGVARGQLIKKDIALYTRLQRRKLLKHVPLKFDEMESDPWKYYKKHYDGLTRTKLNRANRRLYYILLEKRLIERIPAANLKEIARAKSKFGKDALEFYKKHYSGLTRGQLYKEEPYLYARLRKEGLICKVPKGNYREAAIKRSVFGKDAFEYYQTHYGGLTRAQLTKTNESLYKRLRKDGLIHNVPKYGSKYGDPVDYYNKHYKGLTSKELQKKSWGLYSTLQKKRLLNYTYRKNKSIADNPLAYYNKWFRGVNRNQLYKANLKLYMQLYNRGQIKYVPKTNAAERSIIAKKRRVFGEDALAYYKLHYNGLTVSQLREENQSLYSRLLKDHLIEQIPRKKRSFAEDPLAHYTKHYSNISRGRLSKENVNLYNSLRKEGLLDNVPICRQARYNGNLLEYYKEHYNGVTRNNLSIRNPGLYKLLAKEELLDNVPTKLKRDFERNPLAYYNKYYKGFTRSQLNIVNNNLYTLLREKRLLRHISK